MGRSDADRVLHEIRRILRDIQDYANLDEAKRAELVRRAAREDKEIDEVLRLLKRLDQSLRKSKEELAG
jgi:hypothetical protein